MKKYYIQFLGLEEDEKDLIVSFAYDDQKLGTKSIILMRTLFFEEFLDEDERGVKVSIEDIGYEKENRNVLRSIKINNEEVEIKSTFEECILDISKIDESDYNEMIELLKKQNYDNRFTIQFT